MPSLAQGIAYEAYPMAKGKILIRLTNLDNSFDGTPSSKKVNLVQFAQQMWESVNTGQAPKPHIKEMMLDGVKEMFKTEWFAQVK
jgi:hypothetical protein